MLSRYLAGTGHGVLSQAGGIRGAQLPVRQGTQHCLGPGTHSGSIEEQLHKSIRNS